MKLQERWLIWRLRCGDREASRELIRIHHQAVYGYLRRLCSDAARQITGNRYVAAQWDTSLPPAEAEKACRAPAAWPQLGQSPVWPGGKPSR